MKISYKCKYCILVPDNREIWAYLLIILLCSSKVGKLLFAGTLLLCSLLWLLCSHMQLEIEGKGLSLNSQTGTRTWQITSLQQLNLTDNQKHSQEKRIIRRTQICPSPQPDQKVLSPLLQFSLGKNTNQPQNDRGREFMSKLPIPIIPGWVILLPDVEKQCLSKRKHSA